MHFKDGAMTVKHTANYTTEVEQHEKRTQRRSRRMLGDAQWLQQAWPETQCLPLQKPGHSKGNCEAGESPPPPRKPTAAPTGATTAYFVGARAPSSVHLRRVPPRRLRNPTQVAGTARW